MSCGLIQLESAENLVVARRVKVRALGGRVLLAPSLAKGAPLITTGTLNNSPHGVLQKLPLLAKKLRPTARDSNPNRVPRSAAGAKTGDLGRFGAILHQSGVKNASHEVVLRGTIIASTCILLALRWSVVVSSLAPTHVYSRVFM